MNRLEELIEDKEDVTFYPTYGYREGSDWKIPIRIWVHEPCKLAEKLVTSLAESIGKANEKEQKNLKARIADIVADSESGEKVIFIFKFGEKVIFKFDNDPAEEEWEVQSEDGGRPKTDEKNGIIEGFVKLRNEQALTLLEKQGSEK